MKKDIFGVLRPGLSFLAVVVGGGYATGRELVNFYLPNGPVGAFLAMAVTAIVWSLTMMIILEFCRRLNIHDYKTFFQKLIGPGWIIFEVAYLSFLIVVLSVIAAASGIISHNLFNVPQVVGSIGLIGIATILLFFGRGIVEWLLSYWSLLLYFCYGTFFILFIFHFGNLSIQMLDSFPVMRNPIINGFRYAAINMPCFVSILILVPTICSQKQAYVSGALLGPISIFPAALFLFALIAFYPEIEKEAVPLNFLLNKLEVPALKVLFQITILGTLVQTAIGLLQAVNERVETEFEKREKIMPLWLRSAIAFGLMIGSVTVADWIGLIDLIAKGYGVLSWIFIILIFGPVFTVGVYKLYISKISVQ